MINARKQLTLLIALLATLSLTSCSRQSPPTGKPLSEIVTWLHDHGLPDTSDARLVLGYQNETGPYGETGYYWLFDGANGHTGLIHSLTRTHILSPTNHLYQGLYDEWLGHGFVESPYPLDLEWLSTHRFSHGADDELSGGYEFMSQDQVGQFDYWGAPDDPFGSSGSFDHDSFGENEQTSLSSLEALFMSAYLYQNGQTKIATQLWEDSRGDLRFEQNLLKHGISRLADTRFGAINQTFIKNGDLDTYRDETQVLLDEFGAQWIHHERVEKQLADIAASQTDTTHHLGRALTSAETRLLDLIDGTNNMQLYASSEGFYMWCLGHNTNRSDRPSALIQLADMRVDAVPLLIELLQDYSPTQCALSDCDINGLYYLSSINDNYVAIEGAHEPNLGRAATRAEKAASALRWVVETDPATNPDRLLFDLDSSEVNSLKAYQKFSRMWYETHEGLSGVESALAFLEIGSLYDDIINCVATRGTDAQRKILENKMLADQQAVLYPEDNTISYLRESGTNGLPFLAAIQGQLLTYSSSNTTAPAIDTRIFHEVISMHLSNRYSVASLIDTAHQHQRDWELLSSHLAWILPKAPASDSLSTLLKQSAFIYERTNEYLNSWALTDLLGTDYIPTMPEEYLRGTNPLDRVIAPVHRPLWNALTEQTNALTEQTNTLEYLYSILEMRYGSLNSNEEEHGGIPLYHALSIFSIDIEKERGILRLAGKAERELPVPSTFIPLSVATNNLIKKLEALVPGTTNTIDQILSPGERFHTFDVLQKHPTMATLLTPYSLQIRHITELPSYNSAPDSSSIEGTATATQALATPLGLIPTVLTTNRIFTAELAKALFAAAENTVKKGIPIQITVTREPFLGGVIVELRQGEIERPQLPTDLVEIPSRGYLQAGTSWRNLNHFSTQIPVTLHPAAAERYKKARTTTPNGQEVEAWTNADPFREHTIEIDPFSGTRSHAQILTEDAHPDRRLGDAFWDRLDDILQDPNCLSGRRLLYIIGAPGVTLNPKVLEEE